MTKLKKQLASLPENERLELAQELIQSLSESAFNRFFLGFFSNIFKGKLKEDFKQWLSTNKVVDKETNTQEQPDLIEEGAISGDEMKAWIRQQIAESESKYAEEMKQGKVKTYSLEELKAAFEE